MKADTFMFVNRLPHSPNFTQNAEDCDDDEVAHMEDDEYDDKVENMEEDTKDDDAKDDDKKKDDEKTDKK